MVESRPTLKENSICDVLKWIMTQIATYKTFDTWWKLSLGHCDRLGHEWKRSCNMWREFDEITVLCIGCVPAVIGSTVDVCAVIYTTPCNRYSMSSSVDHRNKTSRIEIEYCSGSQHHLTCLCNICIRWRTCNCANSYKRRIPAVFVELCVFRATNLFRVIRQTSYCTQLHNAHPLHW